MAEALAKVREELGADAVILHTRSFKRGGVLGFGAKAVVEITAGRGQDVGRQRRQAQDRERAKRLAEFGRTLPARTSEPAMDRFVPSGAAAPAEMPLAGDLIKKTYAAAKAELERVTPPVMTVAAPVAVAAPAQPSAESQQLACEMLAVKRMVAEMMRQQRRAEPAAPAAPAVTGDRLTDEYLSLLQREVAEELANEVIDRVRHDLEGEELADDKACRRAVRDAVADLLPVTGKGGRIEPTGDGRPRTIALVGPTGVGKTTTIAKLAATFKLKQGKKVGLITLDTYRIAAVDQLRTYAGIIGVPLHVALSPAELQRALEACRDCDVVLIDTAGRSQRDDVKLEELAKFIEAAQAHEVHLVLSSTCSQAVLMEAAERFSRVRTDSIIFTKLDEAVSFGVLLNVLRKVNKKLSYVTTGQEVPHQIEAGNPSRLAALVMGEGSVHG